MSQSSAVREGEKRSDYVKSPSLKHARKSKASNYSSLTGREKPLPFNAVRYIGNMLKEMKGGIQEEGAMSNKSFG